MQNTEIPPYVAFCSNLCNLCSCNPPETDYTEYVNLLKSGLTTDQAVIFMILSKPTPTEIENYQNLQHLWEQEQMSSFKDLLRWYNSKNSVPTLEAMQKNDCFLIEC